MLFPEEKVMMTNLVYEWYQAMKDVTLEADGIFSEKGMLYDVNDRVWARAEWPVGFIHEITKKANRVKQMMAGITVIDSDDTMYKVIETQEELIDILNYARMFAALNAMLLKRHEAVCEANGDDFTGIPIRPGEQRVIGGEKNPLYAREGESSAEYRRRIDGTFAADGSLKDKDPH